MPWKILLLALLIMLLAAPARAQNDDIPSVLDIFYDSVVEETITEKAFWDWWTIEAGPGDILVIDMQASEGLAPLIGILDPAGNLMARSPDGEVNGLTTLEVTAPAPGRYTIVATRVGNLNGTTTGAYTLRLRRANAAVPVQSNSYQDVTWQCSEENVGVFDVTTAVTLEFAEDPRPELSYRITVYGIDGFQPVIRVQFDVPDADEPFTICNTNADETVGDRFTLPGEEPREIDADSLDSASQLLLRGAEGMGLITLTIGSRDGATGRYLAIIEGFSIGTTDDRDIVDVRLGPLAARSSVMQVFMVAAPNSRLDPFLELPDAEMTCDDAGRAPCDFVPSFAGAGATLHEGETVTTITGDRSDAGLLLAPGSAKPMSVILRSRQADTRGSYALVLIGALPPRE